GATTTVEFEITLADISVSPNMIEVPAGALVKLKVTNTGTLAHDLKVGDVGTRMLSRGESQDLTVGPFSEDSQAICTVPGHKDAGMTMMIHVVGGSGSGSGSGHGDSGSGSGDEEDFAKIDSSKAPA
ncbi:MAG TPA: cupredoxin domain-containing protein, partial [Ilumatobacteraceae bacterium]|nr:cupredoxin domain-containing protein [Ilumatobacteraceae bacterium]